MREISNSFEMRFFSHNEKSNGETDFKGETSTLTTEERVKYLRKYAGMLERCYPDFSLREEVVSLDKARELLAKIKPQPKGMIRERMDLTDWKWVGYGEKPQRIRLQRIEGIIPIPTQDFRCFVEFTPKGNVFSVALGEAVKAGVNEEGNIYYCSNQKIYLAQCREKVATAG